MSVEDKIGSFAHLLARQAAREWVQIGSVGVSTLTSMTALGFFHGMIEDTATAMTFGCHYSAAIIGRIVFSLAAMFVICRLIFACPERIFARFFFSGYGTPTR